MRKHTVSRRVTAQSSLTFTNSATFFIERKFSGNIISAGLHRESSLITSASISLPSNTHRLASPVDISAEATPQVLCSAS